MSAWRAASSATARRTSSVDDVPDVGVGDVLAVGDRAEPDRAVLPRSSRASATRHRPGGRGRCGPRAAAVVPRARRRAARAARCRPPCGRRSSGARARARRRRRSRCPRPRPRRSRARRTARWPRRGSVRAAARGRGGCTSASCHKSECKCYWRSVKNTVSISPISSGVAALASQVAPHPSKDKQCTSSSSASWRPPRSPRRSWPWPRRPAPHPATS